MPNYFDTMIGQIRTNCGAGNSPGDPRINIAAVCGLELPIGAMAPLYAGQTVINGIAGGQDGHRIDVPGGIVPYIEGRFLTDNDWGYELAKDKNGNDMYDEWGSPIFKTVYLILDWNLNLTDVVESSAVDICLNVYGDPNYVQETTFKSSGSVSKDNYLILSGNGAVIYFGRGTVTTTFTTKTLIGKSTITDTTINITRTSSTVSATYCTSTDTVISEDSITSIKSAASENTDIALISNFKYKTSGSYTMSYTNSPTHGWDVHFPSYDGGDMFGEVYTQSMYFNDNKYSVPGIGNIVIACNSENALFSYLDSLDNYLKEPSVEERDGEYFMKSNSNTDVGLIAMTSAPEVGTLYMGLMSKNVDFFYVDLAKTLKLQGAIGFTVVTHGPRSGDFYFNDSRPKIGLGNINIGRASETMEGAAVGASIEMGLCKVL